jgi:hypothetical protein
VSLVSLKEWGINVIYSIFYLSNLQVPHTTLKENMIIYIRHLTRMWDPLVVREKSYILDVSNTSSL